MTFKLRFRYGYCLPDEWRHRQHDLAMLLSDGGSFLAVGLCAAAALAAISHSEAVVRSRVAQLRRECDSRHPRLLPEGHEGFDLLWSILCQTRYDPRERDKIAAARPTDGTGRELADGLYELSGGVRELLSCDFYQRRDTIRDPYPHKATIQSPTSRPYQSTLREPGRKQAFAPRTRKKSVTDYGGDLDKVRTQTGDLLEGDLINGRLPRDYEEIADTLELPSMRFHKMKNTLETNESIAFPPAEKQRQRVRLLKKMQDPGPPQLKLTMICNQEDGGAIYRAALADNQSVNE